MKIDITLCVTPKMIDEASEYERMIFTGHLGTHFDIMDKVFPLEYVERKGIVFLISPLEFEQEIGIEHIDTSLIEEGMFVAFCSSFIETVGYGTHEYFTKHPFLAQNLIEVLIEKHISIIGIDFAGIRPGKEHRMADQYCANQNIFVVENLCNLKQILKDKSSANFQVYTFPMNFSGMTGLPCRVIAEV